MVAKNDFTPKSGRRILVSTCGDQWYERVFAWKDSEFYYCYGYEPQNLILKNWKHAKPVAQKKHAPFTQETFPKGTVWVESKLLPEQYLIDCVGEAGVLIAGDFMRFEMLLELYEISLDGRETWHPAGEAS